jgi:hypothetical protein
MIGSVNLTIQRIHDNEQVLKNSMSKLVNATSQKFSAIEEEINNVLMINEQIKIVERGLEELQHSFELLLDAFMHAEQETPQPQLITAEKIKNIVRSQPLPSGLDYPDFSRGLLFLILILISNFLSISLKFLYFPLRNIIYTRIYLFL